MTTYVAGLSPTPTIDTTTPSLDATSLAEIEEIFTEIDTPDTDCQEKGQKCGREHGRCCSGLRCENSRCV